jgi:hypothetical protein
MKLGLRNYAVIMSIENSYSLERYHIAENYNILHKMIRRLSQNNLNISKHCNIQKLRCRK